MGWFEDFHGWAGGKLPCYMLRLQQVSCGPGVCMCYCACQGYWTCVSFLAVAFSGSSRVSCTPVLYPCRVPLACTPLDAGMLAPPPPKPTHPTKVASPTLCGCLVLFWCAVCAVCGVVVGRIDCMLRGVALSFIAQVWTDGSVFHALEAAARDDAISTDEYNHIARMHVQLAKIEKAAPESKVSLELELQRHAARGLTGYTPRSRPSDPSLLCTGRCAGRSPCLTDFTSVDSLFLWYMFSFTVALRSSDRVVFIGGRLACALGRILCL